MGKKRVAEVTAGMAEDLINCPICGASFEWAECGDSDSISMPMDTVRVLHSYLRGGCIFHPLLISEVCASCKQTVYTVQVDVIANPEINEEWVNKYFWMNEVIDESEIPYTVTLSQSDPSDLPSRWLLWRTETAAGYLDRHFLNLVPETLLGEEAVNLIEATWPVLSGLCVSALPCRFEFESRFFG